MMSLPMLLMSCPEMLYIITFFADVFKMDPDYLENEEKYKAIKKEILDEDSDDSDSDEESGEATSSEDSDEEKGIISAYM